jgi:Uncharacterized protein conserved in bacteria (DUF2252)
MIRSRWPASVWLTVCWKVLSGYLGRGDQFDRALANFAERYADQNERDYALLKAAADAGQVEVQSV